MTPTGGVEGSVELVAVELRQSTEQGPSRQWRRQRREPPDGPSIGVGLWEIVASCHVTNRTNEDTTCELRIIEIIGGNPPFFSSGETVLPASGSVNLVVTGSTIGGASYQTQARVLFGGADLSGGARFFMEQPNPPLAPIQHTCKIPFVGNP